MLFYGTEILNIVAGTNLSIVTSHVILCENKHPILCDICNFYPTALKGWLGIVFTYGVWMGRWREKVCPGCISETVRCRKLILGRDIG